jgi:type VI secretion system ImpB/VipA family protein
LLVTGDDKNGQDTRALADRIKVSINKNNFNAVLADYNPKAAIAVENILSGDGTELPIALDFKSMDDSSTYGITSCRGAWSSQAALRLLACRPAVSVPGLLLV